MSLLTPTSVPPQREAGDLGRLSLGGSAFGERGVSAADLSAAPVRPLRCLQIGGEWFAERPGGLERYYADLLHHLPQANVRPMGIVMGTQRAAAETSGMIKGVAPADASIIRRLQAVRREVKVQARAGLDLIASHFALYGLPALAASKTLPWVVHFHGPWAAESEAEGSGGFATKLKSAVERRVYRRGVRFITLSKAFSRLLAVRYLVSPEKIRVIPGGVDIKRFTVSDSRDAARVRLGLPTDRPIVVTIRRLVHRMGLENLIDAAAHPSFRDVLFVVAGRGPLMEALKQRAAEAGAAERIRFLGYVSDDDLPLLYRAADLTVIPSVALEGFGLTAVESLAAGTPTLVTPVGGMPEVVDELSRELVIESNSIEAISEALRRALFGSLRLPDASACSAYAASRFNWKEIAVKVREVYEEAITSA